MSWVRARRGIAVATTASLTAWYGVAWAALDLANTSPDLLNFPWMQAGIAIIITVGAGIASTWQRELIAIYSDTPFDLKREMRKDVAVSVSLGLSGYSAGVLWALPEAALALLLIGLGFAGTRAITGMVDRVLEFIRKG